MSTSGRYGPQSVLARVRARVASDAKHRDGERGQGYDGRSRRNGRDDDGDGGGVELPDVHNKRQVRCHIMLPLYTHAALTLSLSLNQDKHGGKEEGGRHAMQGR